MKEIAVGVKRVLRLAWQSAGGEQQDAALRRLAWLDATLRLASELGALALRADAWHAERSEEGLLRQHTQALYTTHMSDSDEDDDASELSFADPNAAAAAAEQALLDEPSEDEDDAPAKKKQKQKAAKQKAKANKNAPLDEDGKPMIWDADEGGWVRDVGFTEGPEALTEQWIQTRLSPTLMHLEKLLKGGGMHGTSLINHDEMNYCREVLNHALAACLSDLAGAKEKATASSVFWAIALAQNAAAGRPGGWVVDSRSAIDTWSMDTLHAYIENFKGEGTKVDESGSIGGGGPATRIQQAKGG